MPFTFLKPLFAAILVAFVSLSIVETAQSAGSGFEVAANTFRATRAPSTPPTGASGFAAERTRAEYGCVAGECHCDGYADCVNMAAELNCTVYFTPCTGCPTTSGHCRPGQ